MPTADCLGGPSAAACRGPEHRRQVAAAVAIQRVARGWAGRAVARRRRREAADRAALERTRPLVERFLADREHNRAISEVCPF